MIGGLSERLKELRTKRGLSQKEVAQALNISQTILSGYEIGYRTPSIENLLKLSSLYNCSTDYLLGKSKEAPVPVIDTTGLSAEQLQAIENLIKVMRV